MNKNKLIISAAGSGKTTYLVNRALDIKDESVLITTYTINNEREIKKKFIEKNGYIPKNITIQTWMSFLIQHGVKPFQGCLFSGEINGMTLVNSRSTMYIKEKDTEKYYFDNERRIYSDKIANFSIKCNDKSGGNVFIRLSNIYQNIYIDEIQDMAGYDLEVIKYLLESKSKIILVGDPRQVTYHTHNETKNSSYINGKIAEFIKNECKNSNVEIDTETLNRSYRNNLIICNFSSKLFPSLPLCESNQSQQTDHDGIFFIKDKDLKRYLQKYNPIQLRYNKKIKIDEGFQNMNFGESKGLTFDRVLIYPTKDILKWIFDNTLTLSDMTRSKFYVALTRAKYSVGIVNNYNDSTNIENIVNFRNFEDS